MAYDHGLKTSAKAKPSVRNDIQDGTQVVCVPSRSNISLRQRKAS